MGKVLTPARRARWQSSTGRLLCRLGMHAWKLSRGAGFTCGNSRMAIFFDKDCLRCGKHEDGTMLV